MPGGSKHKLSQTEKATASRMRSHQNCPIDSTKFWPSIDGNTKRSRVIGSICYGSPTTRKTLVWGRLEVCLCYSRKRLISSQRFLILLGPNCVVS